MENEVEFHQRNKLLKEMKHEKLQLLQKEKHVLEDIQASVFEEKRKFCSNVLDFIELYGLPAMMLDIEQNGSQAQTKGNYEQLKKEFEEVEREHVKTAKKLEKAKLQLKAGQENQVLLFQDQEIKRKMVLLTEINHQTELLEAECSSLEQDLNHQQHNMEEEENNVVGKDSSATQAEAVPVADSSTGSESVTSSRKFVPKVPSKMARMLHIHYNSKNDNI